MNERQKVEERLRKKEQEIQVFEEKIRSGRVYVQALRDVLKLLSEDEEADETPETVLRPGSAVAQARKVISERGEPVHVNELLAALGRKVTRESRASLTSSLAAYVRRGEIFTRPAPNTFGLIDLGHHTPEEPKNEPPQGFGKVVPPDPDEIPPDPDADDDEIPF